MLTVRSFGLTDRGRVRASNEDQFVNARLSRAMQLQQSSLQQPATLIGEQHGHLFLVADGMGGQAGGEEASALALLTIEEFLLNTLRSFFELQGDRFLAEFQEALRAADARVFAEAARRPELQGMATTLTMGYSTHSALYVVHAGDSRCYLLRGGELHQITRDHTLVEEMVRGGALSAEDAAHSPFSNVVTNFVGGSQQGLKPELHKLTLQSGDVALFCSDGLTGMVPVEEIAAVLQSETDPESACRRLIEMANANGGRDNVTAVVARFEEAR
jgi:protein phosphatase